MNTCYLVLCHTDAAAVLRLVRRIRALSPSSDIVVRYEDPGFLNSAQVEAAGGMPLVSTVEARWGAWSLVEAMVEAVRFGLVRSDAQRFVMVSGQCYPIRDLSAWERELQDRDIDAVLEPIVDHPDDHHFRWFIVTFPRMPTFARRVVWHIGWRLGQVTKPWLHIVPRSSGGPSERRWWIGVPRTRYSGMAPGGIRVTKAATWLMLSRRAAIKILARLDDDHRLVAYFRTVRIPDESVLQSLVNADPELNVHEAVISAKRFPAGLSSPVWLDESELRNHVGSGAPFARKIPPRCDEEVLRIADTAAEA